jgi:thiol-disulfide isomerase/thioredoxin
MIYGISRLCIVLMPLLFIAACDRQTAAVDIAAAAKPFPSVSFVSLDGTTISSGSYRGRLMVLNIWATWCAPCRREMPDLERLSKTLDPQRFAVIGLSADEDEYVVREYLNDKGLTFARFIDKDLKIIRDRLGISVYPATVLIAPNGMLIGQVVGPREWHSPVMIRLLENAYQGKAVRLDEMPVARG